MISCAELLRLAGTLSGSVPIDTLVPAAVDARAREAIAAVWQVAADQVRLEWGQHPSLATIPSGAAVRITGPGDAGWFGVQVDRADGTPILLRVRASTSVMMPIATRELLPGDLLTEMDVGVQRRTVFGRPPVTITPGDIIGHEVHRRVHAGEVLGAPAVAPPYATRPGDRVTLLWQRGTIAFELETEALGSARVGDRIRLRVNGGDTRLSATMTAPSRALLRTGT
jgi:flagella basal body P-ring formation protein FlgA